MNELASWIANHSASVVILLAIAASIVFVAKYLVPKMLDAMFKDKDERRQLTKDLFQRLDEVMSNLYRWRENRVPPDGFFRHSGAMPLGDEIVPLSKIWEDLQANKALLGEALFFLIQKHVQHAGAANNVPLDDTIQWEEQWKKWDQRREKIREIAKRRWLA